MQRQVPWRLAREVLYRLDEFEVASAGQLAGAVGLSFGEAGSALTELELAGLIERAGTSWRLTTKGEEEIHP